MTMQKAIAVVVAIVVVLGALWWGFSSYLVSKLDGSGGITAPQSDLTVFEDAHIGLRFVYPNTYVATTTHLGNAEREWHQVTLLPAGYVPPQGGEGPPAITVQDIPNPEDVGLEAWIKGDARSNWKLAADPGGLGSTRVGGEYAMAYKHSGLYETSAVAVAKNGKIYLFEAGWLTPQDQIRQDFDALLESVEFLP